MRDATDLAITALALRWVYRLTLGREPEVEMPADIVERITDIDLLLRNTANSEEALRLLDQGRPIRGNWGSSGLSEADVAIVARLQHGRWPVAEERAALLARHADAASLRTEFLASPEFDALTHGLGQGLASALLSVGPHQIPLVGHRHDQHFSALALGAIEPSVPILGRVVRALLPNGGKGAMLVDAGANIGLTCAVMGLAAPDHARLLAVEPSTRSIPLLERNLAGNGLQRAEVAAAALGAQEGTALFADQVRDSATGHLLHDLDRNLVRPGQVFVETPVRRLDRLLAERGFTRLDFLKVDVEGFEPAVLEGAGDWLKRHGGAAFVEVNLWTLMSIARRNPLDLLDEWAATYPHLVAFGANGDPVPLTGAEGRHWFIYELVTQRHGLGDIVICHDLDWFQRWA